MRVRGKTKEIRIYTRASRPGTIKVLSTGFAFSPWPSGKCARLFPTPRPGLSSQRLAERVKGGVWSEPSLCSTISGEKLPMNRWTRNDLVNDHDINHCFSPSSRYRSEDGCGLNWAKCSLQETNQTDDITVDSWF